MKTNDADPHNCSSVALIQNQRPAALFLSPSVRFRTKRLYPKGLGYGLVIGARDAAGREEFRIYLDAAIEVPGVQTQRLGEAAAAHGNVFKERRALLCPDRR